MTNILAIDTSTDACSVAVLCNGELHEQVALEPRAHARLCLPMVKALMKQSGLTLKELDAIAFGRGPGSFTGVRIASSITQGLAYSLSLPVVPVSTLAAMAFQFAHKVHYPPEELSDQHVIAILDARMNEVYAAMFTTSYADQQVEIIEVRAETVLAPESISVPEVAFSIIGSGLSYKYRMTELCSAALNCDQHIRPQADAIARLGARYLSQGQNVPAGQAQPVYLRNELGWQKLPGH